MERISKINNFELNGPLSQKQDSSIPNHGVIWFDRSKGFNQDAIALLLRGVNEKALKEHVQDRMKQAYTLTGERIDSLLYRVKRAIVMGVAELNKKGNPLEAIEKRLLSNEEPNGDFEKAEMRVYNEIAKLNSYVENRGIMPFFNNEYLKKIKSSTFEFIRENGMESMVAEFRSHEPDDVVQNPLREDIVSYAVQDAISFVGHGEGEIYAVSGTDQDIEKEFGAPEDRSRLLHISCVDAKTRIVKSKMPDAVKSFYSNFVDLVEREGGISRACATIGLRGYGESDQAAT
ncbi:MAG: hypothetical protein KGH98_03735 [Candidatus Micrarchaeota archaeon]|nr:hypothetical protein [Candidatus Micrarchaeota archaeon]